jgi:hypothetical protein
MSTHVPRVTALETVDRELVTLVTAARAAEERVRTEIVDRIPAPEPIEFSRLDHDQRDALDALYRAQTALTAYRESRCS